MSVSEEFGARVDSAWRGALSFTDLLDFARQLEVAGLAPLAVVLYQTWIGRNQTAFNHAALFNLGTVLTNLGDLGGAEAAYHKAIDIAPAFIHPHLNLGLLHERQGRVAEALAEWQWIVDNSSREEPNRGVLVSAFNHLGRVQESTKQLDLALSNLTQSLRLDPQQPDVLHHWVFLRQKQCAWPIYEPLPGVSEASMRSATSALAMLNISDDPQEQLDAALRFVTKRLQADLPRLSNASNYGHQRIRIGYCSSDFSLHPVSMLTVQLFELHNRAEFEVFGYCWSPEDGSGLRQRVLSAMDQFHRINGLSDEAAAQLIRSHEIDILVDLQGQTSGARADMLGYRPAPIQLTYLGMPATTGLPSIDYVIADEYLIPGAYAPFYTEKPLYMPDVYQVSDRQRVATEAPSRQDCGLPEEGFVFCSFNNSYKYTPEVFAVWMQILQRVPGSVLWLLADNSWSEMHLRAHAASHGVAAERLVFAPRVAPENYLARYHRADLFLDTFPFNAGTTANDCLWMGCPLLTLTGRSFASRMAGALLTAAGLPELICHDLASYADKAVALANDPENCQQLQRQLAQVRQNGVLFDTPRFVRELEIRLKALVQDLPPPLPVN